MKSFSICASLVLIGWLYCVERICKNTKKINIIKTNLRFDGC